MVNGIFINLPIENLRRSVDFFTALGFTFNAQFTSDDSTCMIIGENMYAMLLEKPRFAEFIDKPIAEPTTSEALLSMSLGSRDEVATMVEAALARGARSYMEPRDLGFMFSWGFEDLDGHIWEPFWMDPAHVM